MKINATFAKTARRSSAIALIGLVLCSAQSFAQSTAPAFCVTALSKEYGANTAVQMACANATDCTFQAPIGNASALALIGSMVKTVEACFTASGLSLVKEDTVPQGTTRQYGKTGAPETCAVLISASMGDLADGLRAACVPAAAR